MRKIIRLQLFVVTGGTRAQEEGSMVRMYPYLASELNMQFLSHPELDFPSAR